MRKFFTSLFALAFSVSSAYAGGTLTLMGVGNTNVAKKPSVVFTQNLTSTSGTTSHSFSANIGTPAPGRLVVVAVQLLNTTLSSPTIGGVSATIYAQAGASVGIFGAVVPSGTTATVTFNTSGTAGNFGGVWAIYDLNSPTPIDIKSNSTLGNSTLAMTTQSDGVLIASAVGFRSGGLTCTLGGVTQNQTGAYNANYRMSSGSGLAAGSVTNVTTTWSAAPTSITGFIAVSWR